MSGATQHGSDRIVEIIKNFICEWGRGGGETAGCDWFCMELFDYIKAYKSPGKDENYFILHNEKEYEPGILEGPELPTSEQQVLLTHFNNGSHSFIILYTKDNSMILQWNMANPLDWKLPRDFWFNSNSESSHQTLNEYRNEYGLFKLLTQDIISEKFIGVGDNKIDILEGKTVSYGRDPGSRRTPEINISLLISENTGEGEGERDLVGVNSLGGGGIYPKKSRKIKKKNSKKKRSKNKRSKKKRSKKKKSKRRKRKY